MSTETRIVQTESTFQRQLVTDGSKEICSRRKRFSKKRHVLSTRREREKYNSSIEMRIVRTDLEAYFTGRIENRLSRKRYLSRRRIYFIILSYHERNTIHRPRRTNRTNGISVVGASCGLEKFVRGERVSSEEEGDGIWMKEKWRKRCRCCGSRSPSRNIRQENGIPGGGGNALQRVSHFGLLAHALPPPNKYI